MWNDFFWFYPPIRCTLACRWYIGVAQLFVFVFVFVAHVFAFVAHVFVFESFFSKLLRWREGLQVINWCCTGAAAAASSLDIGTSIGNIRNTSFQHIWSNDQQHFISFLIIVVAMVLEVMALWTGVCLHWRQSYFTAPPTELIYIANRAQLKHCKSISDSSNQSASCQRKDKKRQKHRFFLPFWICCMLEVLLYWCWWW